MLSFLVTLAVVSLQSVPDNSPDLRCFAILNMVAGNMPTGTNAEVNGAVMFYYGRIEGRTPGFDLEGGLRPLIEPATLSGIFETDLKRCSDELARYGGALGRVGRNLPTLANQTLAK